MSLARLLRPRSVAVVGGGAWVRSVLGQLDKSGFAGPVWHVHPKGPITSVDDLPEAPDAAFIGINREATIGTVAALRATGAGGAVCFAAGFAEHESGQALNAALLEAAGEMPVLGPNCYGYINMVDGALLWPDQQGLLPCERGVAILTQSSNIAINLTMQARALPVAFVITCGNMAQTSQAAIAMALLDDDRVTAIGLHIEGFGDLDEWQALARKARAKGVPLVALKVGASEEARAATLSHTASLAGSDAGASALLARLGIARVGALPGFLETLKLLHFCGPLPNRNIASLSCSGGEASLIADMAKATDLRFPPLDDTQRGALFAALGERVALANPLDYNTYIWRDTKAMADAFSGIAAPHLALVLLIVDFPRADRCDPSDWDCAINAAIAARAGTGIPYAMVASLPELMPEGFAAQLAVGGVVPFCGLAEALTAAEAACIRPAPDLETDLLPPGPARDAVLVSEGEAKAALAGLGLTVPQSRRCAREEVSEAAEALRFPLVLKSEGLAHKSEAGGVALGLTTLEALEAAAARMPGENFLLEEMVSGAAAELLVGVIRDGAHGFVLTLGAGGVLTELLADTQSLLLPASRGEVRAALMRLRLAPLLTGYRGKPAANIDAVLDAVAAIASYVSAHAGSVEEVEVNPLLATPEAAVAADALIRKAP